MPLPHAYKSVLDSATPEIVNAGVHAVAAIILHLVGHQRLERSTLKNHCDVLRELLTLVREETDVRP